MTLNPRKFVIVLLGSIVLLSIAKSFYFTEKFGGTDLRCRIVGSRLLLTDNSPYFYKWHQGDDVRYLDPNDDIHRQVNGNVVTPALLLLNKPLSFFSYRWIRICWTIIQYVLFVLSLFFIWSVNVSRKDLVLPLTIILFGFLMSGIWFINVERGQTYILYAFIFSCSYYIYHKKWKHSHLFAGLIMGFAVWIRPLFLFVNIPFLLLKNFRWLIGSFIGFSVGMLLFFIPMQESWNDYRTAMKHYDLEVAGKEVAVRTNEVIIKPLNIEGISNLTYYKVDGTSWGLMNIQQYMSSWGLFVDANKLMISFGMVVSLVSLLLLSQSKIIMQQKTDLFLISFFLYMLSELFVIGPRGAYNIIEWLFAYFIMLIAGKKNIMVTILLALGVAFMNGWPFSFPHQNEIGELIAFYVLIDFIFIHNISGHIPNNVYDLSS